MITVDVKGVQAAMANIRAYSADVQADVNKALNDTAQGIRGQAIKSAPVNKVSGGGTGFRGANLRRLITADPVKNFETKVESRAKYSEFVEYGTGIYGENPEGRHRQTPWVYYSDALDRFVVTRGSRPQPFFWPSVESERPTFYKRMRQALKL